MQGTSLKKLPRVLTVLAFVLTFLAGAAVMFYLVHLAGSLVGLALLSGPSRLVLASLLLLALALADKLAISRGTYCPISWRRQTPRTLFRRFPIPLAVSIWGFDTGLVVTTFRVAAVTWGSLLLTLLGVAPPWAGLAYGIGFTVPFLFLALRPQLGQASRDSQPTDPGLEALLRQRVHAQLLSAVLLVLSGIALLAFLSVPV